MALIATSSHVLNSSGDGDSTASLDYPFLCFTTHSMKKFLLVYNLNLPLSSLSPVIFCPVAWEKRQTPSCYILLSGSCGEGYSFPRASFSLAQTTALINAIGHPPVGNAVLSTATCESQHSGQDHLFLVHVVFIYQVQTFLQVYSSWMNKITL